MPQAPPIMPGCCSLLPLDPPHTRPHCTANLLKPALARGDLHCIGATTVEEYRKHIEADGAFARRFQVRGKGRLACSLCLHCLPGAALLLPGACCQSSKPPSSASTAAARDGGGALGGRGGQLAAGPARQV